MFGRYVSHFMLPDFSKIDHGKWSLKSLQDFHFWEKVWLTNKRRARNYNSDCKPWILMVLTCFDQHWGRSQFLAISCYFIIQRPPGPIQRDTIQLCTDQRQLGYEQATKCTEAAQKGKYWS
jgi:hypothetical protein